MSDKAIGIAVAAFLGVTTAASAAVVWNDRDKFNEPAKPAFGPNGTDAIVSGGLIYIVRPTVPRF